jgi:hypothetical protein
MLVNLGYWLHPDSYRVVRTITVPDDTKEAELNRIAYELGLHVVSMEMDRS